MHGFETILPFLKPIEHLILDNTVSEVMVNGPGRVFIERDGYVQPVPGIELGERSLTVAVKNIARRLGDDISESKPILDSRLPDGSRVAAVIPPCSLAGVTLTIRKFNRQEWAVKAGLGFKLPGQLKVTYKLLFAKRYASAKAAKKDAPAPFTPFQVACAVGRFTKPGKKVKAA